MSVLPPTSAPDRLNSLENHTMFGQPRETMAELNTENTGPGLVQRCVVVQKDQLGFGFTVCGERIKLVQNVRPGGAAMKAGVHEGDRIIKVNGSLVSSMSHQQVVKLIKSGTYVALTLQGPPPSSAQVPLQPLTTHLSTNHRTPLGNQASPPNPLPLASISSPQRITGPKPLQDPEVQKHATDILRRMLQQEETELQGLLERMSRNPSPSLEERIERARRRASQVRVKMKQDLDGVRSESGTREGHQFMDWSEGEFEACESPHSAASFSSWTPPLLRWGSDTNPSVPTGLMAQIIGPEEEDEDESYSHNEVDGPFQDLELLKTRPAHMIVFMRYIFSQLLDPNPLLFYLSVEAYLGSSPKDARALAPQICAHFLDPEAPLKIRVRDEYLSDIDGRLQAQEDIRGPLSELQQQVLPDIQNLIQDYRNQQIMGLGALFGEADLPQLDGDPAKEKQVVDRQVTALWEILAKHEEDRSSPLASTVLLYLRHAGVKLRDARLFPGLASEREKWLPFFPKAKKLMAAKKERDGEDWKRKPILKYIGKPRSTSQSITAFHVPLSPTEVRQGSVRNIIQQFENHQPEPAEGDSAAPRLSTSCFGEDFLDRESPALPSRLSRSESLKAQGEGRRRGGGAGVESVPRSRSDVDMEDCGEDLEGRGLHLLQHSTSSSSSARSLENPTPPYTPRSVRRGTESPVAWLLDAPALDEDSSDTQNWQETVEPQKLMSLSPREVDRQAVIYELFTTELSHLRTLRVLDQVFFQKMRAVLSSEELACIFPNLLQVYELHANLCESMKKMRESPIVEGIGDIMLARFEGVAGQEFQEHVSHLCSQQSRALELIKNKQRKDPRFAHVIQECESNPHCRRLQLKDLLVSEMQRLTKYPLLLDNIIKYTDSFSPDLPLLQQAQACCRGILQAVNEVVRETEHRQRLSQYQRRLDTMPLERQANPVAAKFKNLDLSSKKMVHEGLLTWRVSKDKAVEVLALLLSDLLVLLQKGPDERLVLRCPSRYLGAELKTTFCPVVPLDSLLVRSVATDNKALYVISASEGQIYELVAGTPSEKNAWKDMLEKTISLATTLPDPANSRSASVSSTSINMDSSVLLCSHVYQSGDVLPKGSLSLGNESSNDDERMLTPTPQTDQSRPLIPGVAEAALDDVETLRQLIFRDLGEDCWSQHSDNTPTNETANEKVPFANGLESDTPEPAPCPSQWDEADVRPLEEEHSVQVVRKAEGAVTDSFPDDVTLLYSQSDMPRGRAYAEGNTFYLIMPKDAGETDTDEVIESRLRQEVMSLFPVKPEEAMCLPWEQSQKGLRQSQVGIYMIKNVEEIFHTIEQLMVKLQQLKEMEAAHQKLLKTLREQPVNQESGDHSQTPPTAVCAPSLDRGAGAQGGVATQPVVHSTGF